MLHLTLASEVGKSDVAALWRQLCADIIADLPKVLAVGLAQWKVVRAYSQDERVNALLGSPAGGIELDHVLGEVEVLLGPVAALRGSRGEGLAKSKLKWGGWGNICAEGGILAQE